MRNGPPEDAILLGTIALEPQRWTTRKPSFPASAVLPWAREVGFDGVELWGPHYADAEESERVAISEARQQVIVYSGYADMGAGAESTRRMEAKAASALCARCLKFNLGNDPSTFDEEVETVLGWLDLLPGTTALLCECHPGTTVDTPSAAARAFAKWPQDRLFAIVHPLRVDQDELDEWFDKLGPRITHAHMQSRTKDGVFLSLDEDERRLRQRVEKMHERGFSGSWTIEFVKGTRTQNDQRSYLMEQAAADHAILSALLGREAATQQ
jgi:sugar phosphate isomerase/epimerase